MKKILALIFALCSMTAQATLIDFQDLPSGHCAAQGSDGVTSGGFMFNGNITDPGLWTCEAGAVGSNTSDALLNANGQSIYSMSAWGGVAFSLNFFEAGNRSQPQWYATSGGVLVTGYVADGPAVTQTFNFDGDNFGLFLLNSQFTNLIAVSFTSIGSGNSEFLLDNIGVNGATPVPEPSMIMLMMVALAVIAAVARQRRKNAGL